MCQANDLFFIYISALPSYVGCKYTAINKSADSYIKENVDSVKKWVPKYPYYCWEQPAKKAQAKMEDPVLAEFTREKTMELSRAVTPALMRMPTGLNLLPEADV